MKRILRAKVRAPLGALRVSVAGRIQTSLEGNIGVGRSRLRLLEGWPCQKDDSTYEPI
jgi:hypothetical protein